MDKKTLKAIFIILLALFAIVKCGSSIFKKTDGKIALNSRISTEEITREPIINSINPLFIYNSYIEAIDIYKERRAYANQISEQIEKESETEITKDQKSEIKNKIIFNNRYNGEEAINRHLTTTAQISLFTPFLFIFCIVAIIIAANNFRWEQLSGSYFDRYRK